MSPKQLPVEERFDIELAELQSSGKYRCLQSFNRQRIDFSSNDYLSLSLSGKLNKEMSEHFQQESTIAPVFGATGSRLISGHSEHFDAVEQMIAAFHQTESSLLFHSGYDANAGLLSTIARRTDTFLYDEYCHASIRDGIRLSSARAHSFRHNDIEDLRAKILRATGNVFIVVESLYSMDGDLTPMKPLAEVARQHDAALIVDEAHSTGVFGKNGEGYVQSLGLKDAVWARVHTFGKALGTHGAAVCGSSQLRQYLINKARPFIYTTAMPDFQLSSIEKAYTLQANAHQERSRLRALRDCFLTYSKECKFTVSSHPSPIQYVLMPGEQQVCGLAKLLREKGFEVTPIRPPTVPAGAERIRICLHAHNTQAEIGAFFDILRNVDLQQVPNGYSIISS